jgi:hypothetical protein
MLPQLATKGEKGLPKFNPPLKFCAWLHGSKKKNQKINLVLAPSD